MIGTEQTQQQVERFLKKVAQKFTANDCDMPMTDIHLRVSQDSGVTTLLLLVAILCMI